MKQITVREFRTNLKKYLSIPCQVTSRGIPIASIVPVKAGEKPDPTPLGMTKKETTYVSPVKEMSPSAIKEVTSGEIKTQWFSGHKYRIYPNGKEELIV